MTAVRTAASFSYPRRPRTTFFVDSVDGDDANPGTSGAPMVTLTAAVSRLANAGGGTVYVRAPSTAPLLEKLAFTFDRAVIVLPWEGDPWHMDGEDTRNACVLATGRGTLTLVGGDFSRSTAHGVQVGAAASPVGTGYIVAEDCVSHDNGDSGWGTVGVWGQVELTRCDGYGNVNDGFNEHGAAGVAGVMTLTDCNGYDNGDEGVSPHDDVIMHIVGGSFYDNVQSGMAAVGAAVCNISGGASFTGNGTGGTYGGVYFSVDSSGQLNGMAATANLQGPGVWIATTGTVTLTAYTSSGNGAADIIP